MKVFSIKKTILASLITIFVTSACHSIPKTNPQVRNIIHHSAEQQTKLNAARKKMDAARGDYGKVLGEIRGEDIAFSVNTRRYPVAGTNQTLIVDHDNGNTWCEDGDARVSCQGGCPC